MSRALQQWQQQRDDRQWMFYTVGVLGLTAHEQKPEIRHYMVEWEFKVEGQYIYKTLQTFRRVDSIMINHIYIYIYIYIYNIYIYIYILEIKYKTKIMQIPNLIQALSQLSDELIDFFHQVIF